jgi:signal transduction histidine kinase
VIENDSLLASIPLPYFTDIIVTDAQNNYWCFARNGTILAYTLAGQQLKQVASFTDNSYSPRFALHRGSDSFYIGTRNNGIILVKASPAGYKKTGTISTADGLSNNFITGLLTIDKDRLLTASVTGLDIVHFSAGGVSAEQLFSRTGLFTGVPALVRSNDSTALVLTDGGDLYQLGIKQAASTTISPSLFFSSITVNGSPVNPDKDITFTYNRNNFRIAVSAPGFIDEKNIRFIFSLNGQKIITGPATRSGETEFTNLAPGSYTITVTALFPGNDTTRKSISYSFRIRKPFWKTYGFIAALTLLILLLIYSIFRVQLRRKLQLQQIELEKEKAIARERSRIASDMHDDLGAGISTIKYLSQSAPFISPDVQKENNLKIAAQADDLVDKMNDIIWAMNEKNDTLDNLVFYTKAWIANFAQQHDIAADITIPSAIPSTIIRGEKRQHIFLCIKEAVHNIIKHAGADQLWLSLTLNDQQLQVYIKDNGRGFDTKKMAGGNGLANMRKRIKAVKGQISIESGNGTTIRFSVPL